MKYVDKSCAEFTELTAGKVSVPGGGSVSALAGALGAALGKMVGNYTVGKKSMLKLKKKSWHAWRKLRESEWNFSNWCRLISTLLSRFLSFTA